MTDSSDVPIIADMIDADTMMYRLKLQGFSIRELARKFNCPQRHVKEAIERALEPIDAFTRGRMLQIELERCEELQLAHHAAATAGDLGATAAVIKVMEHRAALGGLYASNASRIGPVELVEQAKEKINTTTQIQKVLDDLASRARPKLIAGRDVDVEAPAEGEKKVVGGD